MYIVLRPKVIYRRELGYVFADDGERVFRIEEADFDRLHPVPAASGASLYALSGTSDDAATLSETIKEALLQRFPSLFQRCASQEEAEVSFREQEY